MQLEFWYSLVWIIHVGLWELRQQASPQRDNLDLAWIVGPHPV